MIRNKLMPVYLGLMFCFSGTVMADEVGSVNYRFKWLGPSDKIVVEAFDDPEVPGVACYISRAETGGLKGRLCRHF